MARRRRKKKICGSAALAGGMRRAAGQENTMDLFYWLVRGGGVITFPNTFYAAVWIAAQVLGMLFILMYLHQLVYLIAGTFVRFRDDHVAKVQHTIGIVVSARNESAVIGNLIRSIQKCDYPQEKLRVFVIADNCTDDTAKICRGLGCTVFERHDLERIGKGFALHWFFEQMHTDPQYAELVPEAYIVVDADNLLKSDFITEMNRAFDSGYGMVTSYRNTKNFCKNWITAGYGYWFLHEARHLSNCRRMFRLSCAISGTGFLIASDVVKEYDNWNFFTLTEDIECSTAYALSGRKVGYAPKAELYDEQPEKFSHSWRQRERWAKGFYQVFGKSGGKLIGRCFKSFSCYDILTTIFPALIYSLLVLIGFPVCAIVAAAIGDTQTAHMALLSVAWSMGTLLVMMLLIALLVCITEWKHIKGHPAKKILFIFTFPLFMATYIPIAFVALFKKVRWKPIPHTANVKIEELTEGAADAPAQSTPAESAPAAVGGGKEK